MGLRYAALRGTRDILPDEIEAWLHVERTARDLFRRYGFREIRTPVLEATELFARSVGEASDIVHKEMYTFRRGDESVSLRPECTASVARAVVEHSLHRGIATGYPERLYYIGPMFRYERPQRGRQRQFHQIGAEVLGAAEPLADAETIEMLWSLLSALGIEDRKLVLNSLGDEDCRVRYRAVLAEWLAVRADLLCEDCRRRAQDNPLRVFDCKIDSDIETLSGAPKVSEHLGDEAARHFADVQAWLGRFGVPFDLEPRMVRGLDYYRRTVFEVVSGGLGAQSAILGGGRYDGLIAELGGPPVPGFGFAIGMERLISLLPGEASQQAGIDVALIGLGVEGWNAAVDIARRLRAAGRSVLLPIVERPMGAQMKRADRAGARFAAFVGQNEIAAGRVSLKDLRTGEQTEVQMDALAERVGEA